jgi:hypothetical protein
VQQEEVQIEDITRHSESGTEEGEQEAGPSSASKEERETTHSEILAQAPEVPIVLPHIPEGVHATTGLLGYVDKLRYADHDVSDTENSQNSCNKFTWKSWAQGH